MINRICASPFKALAAFNASSQRGTHPPSPLCPLGVGVSQSFAQDLPLIRFVSSRSVEWRKVCQDRREVVTRCYWELHMRSFHVIVTDTLKNVKK